MTTPSSTDVTPKIIHQTWKTKDVPYPLSEYVLSVKKLNPGYEYKLWTDEDIDELIKTQFPQYYTPYKQFQQHIERVDFVRYAILYLYGGIYLDLDIECFKSLDPLVNKNRIILADEPLEHRKHLYKNRQHVLCNAMMISPEKQMFWIKVMNFIVQTYKRSSNPVYNTGPMMLTRFYEQDPGLFNQFDVLILPSCSFFAQTDRYTKNTINGIPYISNECIHNLKDAYAIHRWSHTWIDSYDEPIPPGTNIDLTLPIINDNDNKQDAKSGDKKKYASFWTTIKIILLILFVSYIYIRYVHLPIMATKIIQSNNKA